jgi:hypothetical protein
MTSSHPTPTIVAGELTGPRTRRRDGLKPGSRLVPLLEAAAALAAAGFAHRRTTFENAPGGSRYRPTSRPWAHREGTTDREGGA